MNRHRTFSQKVGAGFGVIVLLTAVIGVVAVIALHASAGAKDEVVHIAARQQLDLQQARVALERKTTAARTFLLTGENRYLDQMQEARTQFTAVADELRGSLRTDKERSQLAAVTDAEARHQHALDPVIALIRSGAGNDAVARAFDEGPAILRETMDLAIGTFSATEDKRLIDTDRIASAATARNINVVIGMSVAPALTALVLAIWLAR